MEHNNVKLSKIHGSHVKISEASRARHSSFRLQM